MEDERKIVQLYRDKAMLWTQIIPDDAQLGKLFRAIINHYNGIEPDFSEQEAVLKAFYDDFARTDNHKRDKYNNLRLGGLVTASQNKHETWEQFVATATGEPYNFPIEKLMPYRDKFSDDTEEPQEQPRKKDDKEEDPEIVAWFTDLIKPFPAEKRAMSVPYDKVFELYNNEYPGQFWFKEGITKYLDSLNDIKYCVGIRKYFFESDMYMEWANKAMGNRWEQ